jgi:hypothetical protein
MNTDAAPEKARFWDQPGFLAWALPPIILVLPASHNPEDITAVLTILLASAVAAVAGIVWGIRRRRLPAASITALLFDALIILFFTHLQWFASH